MADCHPFGSANIQRSTSGVGPPWVTTDFSMLVGTAWQLRMRFNATVGGDFFCLADLFFERSPDGIVWTAFDNVKNAQSRLPSIWYIGTFIPPSPGTWSLRGRVVYPTPDGSTYYTNETIDVVVRSLSVGDIDVELPARSAEAGLIERVGDGSLAERSATSAAAAIDPDAVLPGRDVMAGLMARTAEATLPTRSIMSGARS